MKKRGRNGAPEPEEEENGMRKKGKEKPKSVVERIRKKLRDAEESSGGNMPDTMAFIAKDGIKRWRFLTDFDEALPVTMHDKYGSMYPQPCLKYYDKNCPFHEKPIRTSEQYVFTVYDYEMGQKLWYMVKATRNSCLEDLLEIFDENGTITDRDIQVKRLGEGKKTHYKAKELAHKPTKFEGKSKQAFTSDFIFKELKQLINVSKPPKDENGEEEPEENEEGNEENGEEGNEEE